MKQFVVTIHYNDEMTTTNKTISFWRKAAKCGEAIASATAIFNSLSNTFEDGGKSSMTIWQVEASEYIPD